MGQVVEKEAYECEKEKELNGDPEKECQEFWRWTHEAVL